MASLYDKIRQSVRNGVLRKQWKEAKKQASTLKLPKKDFGTDLDSFEGSCKTVHALSAEITKLTEMLKQERQQCNLYARSALSTGELYKEIAAEGSATDAVNTLDNIMTSVKQQQEGVNAVPVLEVSNES